MSYFWRIGEHPFPSIDNVLFVEDLKHNLLNISQLCDCGYGVSFNKEECITQNNLHKINLTNLTNQSVTCLFGHASLRLISKLKKYNLVGGLPSLKGKQLRGFFESKTIVPTSRPLELLHMDLFCPIKTTSMSEKYYGLVVVDDYYKWICSFIYYVKEFKMRKGINIASIRSDHGGKRVLRNINKVVERKNRFLPKITRIMLNYNNSLKSLLYELWKDRQPNISYFHHFECECFILNTEDNLRKFDPKPDKETFLGYSEASKAYKKLVSLPEDKSIIDTK
ncbi:hypothetical protein CR513_19408, partial [Mucuna pruriens]